MYAHINLTTLSILGTPGSLPDYLTGLDQAHLADMSWCDGYPDLAGTGYWPVVDDDSAITAGLVASGEDSFAPDATTKTVTQHLGARAMTTDELAEAKSAALVRLAANRYAAQIGGTTAGGAPIKTDTDSLTLVNGAKALVDALAAAGTANPTVQFKGASGAFVTLTQAQMDAIALAVGQHVQNCFANESAIAAQIHGATDGVTLAAINLNAGWPS